MIRNVVIIGGGASGIMCALHLSRINKEIKITILEKQNRVGKKLLVTGNGRCNLTNMHVTKKNYNQTKFLEYLLDQFSFEDCKRYFEDLGLFLRTDDVGRSYPHSESAKAFLDLLLFHLEKNQVNIKTSIEVIDVIKQRDKYLVKTSNKEYLADAVVFASGGQAGINFGNKTYQILEKLNHHIVPIKPGLVPLKVQEDLKHLHGIRVKTVASLVQNNQKIFSEKGEIQFRNDGLSGILSLELSSKYNRLNNRDNIEVSLDLMEHQSHQKIKAFLVSKQKQGFSNDELLIGLFNKMIAQELLNRTQGSSNFIDSLTNEIKDFRFRILETYPFNNAQVTIGGISILEINQNFESLINPNLYIIGELLDVDGDTGGYNLHFAWLSGIFSANNIGGQNLQKRKY